MRAINHHIVTGLTVWALTGTLGYGLVAAAAACRQGLPYGVSCLVPGRHPAPEAG